MVSQLASGKVLAVAAGGLNEGGGPREVVLTTSVDSEATSALKRPLRVSQAKEPRRRPPEALQPYITRIRLACASRYIDCTGLETFRENWPATKLAYEVDTNLAKNVPFAEAERTLDEVTAFFAALGVFPLQFPLPESTVRDE